MIPGIWKNLERMTSNLSGNSDKMLSTKVNCVSQRNDGDDDKGLELLLTDNVFELNEFSDADKDDVNN